jgi:hypothetical protein
MTTAADSGIGQSSLPGLDQILDTMISLTRLASVQRVIVAGDDSMALYLALRRLGFPRVTTPTICRIPKAQHAVGLVISRNAGVEAILDQLSPFLAINAAVALLVGVRDNSSKIRTKLRNLGFGIEAGVRCTSGLVLSACREGYGQMEHAA